MLPDLVGSIKVERIAVLVSYNDTAKFLGAPKIPSSTGKNIATAVYNLLNAWNIADRVTGMGFDTTSSNTGSQKGACLLLQNRLGRKLINFACRHHIYEIILRSVFELKLGPSSAPEVKVFERFMTAWPNIDQSSFQSGIHDEIVKSTLSEHVCNDMKNFCSNQLTKSQTREEYNEFLQLTLLFLGGGGGNFRAPGPTSSARWMAKGIYSLKIFLFRDQFHLNARELKGLRDVCIFLVRIYVKAWFGCTNAISAPNQDYNFIKDAVAYAQTDAKVSEAVLKKMSNHCWYLSEEAIALAFFDPEVPREEKVKMAHRLQFTEPVIKLCNDRQLTTLNVVMNHNLSDFVSSNTEMFFARFGISFDFLHSDPSTWELNEDYQTGIEICRQMNVVNDTAERGVKFMKDYNRVLTTNEDEKQFLMQIVAAYREKYPSFKKSCLISE